MQHTPVPPGGKKRLLVVSQHFWPEHFRINDMVEGFLAHGIEVDVLCGLPNYPSGEWAEGYRYTGPRRQQYHGAQVFRSGEIRRKNNTSLRIFLNYCSFPLLALFNLPRLCRRRYDAVLCYETSPVMMMLPAIVLAKLRRLPLAGYVLDLWPDNLYSVLPVNSGFWRAVAQRVSRWHYRRCTRLVALSPAQARLLRQMTAGAKHPPEIAVIPQYSEDFYAERLPAPPAALAHRGRFNILFAGNFSPAQDLENLLRAVKRVAAQPGGENINVLLLGDGMSRQALEEDVHQQGLAGRVHFCGSVPPQQVPGWTGFADALFAGLSESENLALTVPAKIASYMAAQKPLLVATGGEGQRAAQESGGALTSPPGDDAALAANILTLARMPAAQREEMGRAAGAYYRRHYRRDDLLKQLEEFIFQPKPPR